MSTLAKKPRAARRSPAGGLTLGQLARSANRYRDGLNPLRGLTISRAVSLAEAFTRGDYADLMWTFGAPFVGLECADADLLALIECRTSVLVEMDWNAKICDPEKRPDFDESLAKEQQAAIREWVNGISNLYEAVEHLEMSAFRAFSHCEKIHRPDGELSELRIVDQWNIVRDGTRGEWKYNPEARTTTFTGLSDDLLIDPSSWLIVTNKRPIGRIALVKAIRENLCEKDWDAFVEIYGIPGGVVIGPPNIPPDKEDEYRDSAEKISQGGSGYLPNGSEYKTNDSPRGNNPFRDRMKALTEKLVLAGTGGKLTMLTESGSGTLAGEAHTETFNRIGRKQARRHSEEIQRQIIAEKLDEAWPDKPQLAYFELAFREEVEASQVVKDAKELAQAGYVMDVAELSEKSGYKLTRKEQQDTQKPGDRKKKEQEERILLNREGNRGLSPERARALRDALPDILPALDADPRLAAFLEEVMAASFVAGAVKGNQ